MKNASLILNGVLLVAVAVLYFLHFSSGAPAAGNSGSANVPSNIKVAYIVEDSVLKYYDYFKVNRDKLQAKSEKYRAELGNRQQSLQREIEQYQRNISNLTIGQAKAIEEDLGKKQQNFQMYQQTLEQEMMGEEQKVSTDLYEKITAYLKKYGNEHGLDVVLKFDRSSDLLFGGQSLDITNDVVKGLNDDYKLEASKPAPADTTAKKKK